jgi:hypothetical protein
MDELKQLIERITELERRVAQIEASSSVTERTGGGVNAAKSLSVREFILEKKPSSDVQMTLALACYLEKHKNLSPFSVDDLGSAFQAAKESAPQNINDKIYLNIKKGHMAEAKEKKNGKKAWIVTNSGERFLENGFKSELT